MPVTIFLNKKFQKDFNLRVHLHLPGEVVDLLDFEATVVIAHERQGDEDVVVDRWTRPAAGSRNQTLLEEEEAFGP